MPNNEIRILFLDSKNSPIFNRVFTFEKLQKSKETTKEETLCDKYRNSVNEYIKKFLEQFEEKFLGWKDEKFGEIACFSSGFNFEFADIRYFVDNKINSNTHLVYFHGFNENFPKAKCTLKEYTEKSDKEILYSRIK